MFPGCRKVAERRAGQGNSVRQYCMKEEYISTLFRKNAEGAAEKLSQDLRVLMVLQGTQIHIHHL